ncbi:hypothetical protein BASA61_005600 [Batrachochytrium salamandrivorans]|nr:hypothetical protein BASA61_005600 [Batrachochytrium salamandrivorans]
MKVNVLVVAAMVITSVNASWHELFTSCFWGRCMAREESNLNLVKHMEDTSQDPDPTNNKDGIVETPECVALSLILHDYQDSIFMLSDKYLKSQFTINRIEIKISYSKPKKENRYRTLQSIAHATMEEIRGKATTLRNGHAEFWNEFLDEKCTDKSKKLSPP